MSFTDDVRSFKDLAKTEVLQVKRAASAELFGSVIRDTPVDEGTLVANWRASVGSPNSTVTEEKDKSRNGIATASVAKTQALQVKLGQSLFLSNFLPYAWRIEFEGWSQQARQGMVRINVQRVAKNIKRFIRK